MALKSAAAGSLVVSLRYPATAAACHDGVGATLEKPPPDVMSAPVAVEHVISVPPVAHSGSPAGAFVQ